MLQRAKQLFGKTLSTIETKIYDIFDARGLAYRIIFNASTKSGQIVLADLLWYGHVFRPLSCPEDEGKRKVVLRILTHLRLKTDELFLIYQQGRRDLL